MRLTIYRLSDGVILRTVNVPFNSTDKQINGGEEFFLNCPEGATHVIDGNPVTIEPPPPPAPTGEELTKAIVDAIQNHLDTEAQSHGYDSILSLSSYAVSTDPIFAAEGAAGAAWRDTCWRACANALAEVDAGTRAMPTPEGAVSELPPMLWPKPAGGN